MEYKVPIEIVLQDPSDPIVPDTSDTTGGGSSTSAPNTAVGEGGLSTTTKDTNSTGGLFGSSSASTSIVAGAAIIMMLAISATIATLIHRHYKNKKFGTADNKYEKAKATRKDSLVAAATSTLAIIAAVVMVNNLGIAATNAANEPTYLDVADKIQIVANRYEDVTIVASTKNISYATTDTSFGYKVFMSMAGDSANLYLDGDETSEYYFAPTTKLGLSDNGWGYSLTNGEDGYLAMPLVSDPLLIKQNTSATEAEEIDVYYTMKADKDMPYGIYKGEITYTIEGFNGFPASLTTMQGMTSAICDAVYTPGNSVEDVVPTATLIDTRDQKTYEVAKLADGHCWMVQNLDLDLSTETALVPATSNVSASWTPENSTIATGNLSSTTWPSNTQAGYDPYSYDPGDVFYYSSGTTADDTQYTSLEDCQAEHPDCSMKNHAGNYYSWSAAVASNDTSASTTMYTNMEDSICPAGWELPTGRQNDNDLLEDNELGTLVNSYGILGRLGYCGGTCVYYSYADGGFNTIRTAPLWLARSGAVYGGSIDSTANGGFYWSSTVYSSSNACFLNFSSGNVNPANNSNRHGGRSVRCLAQ